MDDVSLQAIVERVAERGERIDIALCVKTVIECCAALQRAPDPKAPRVRRLIRPETFVLARDGSLRLVVKYWDDYDGRLGEMFRYASPEEAKGLRWDERSDVFVLGIILWELLADNDLFVGDTDYQVLEAVRAAF